MNDIVVGIDRSATAHRAAEVAAQLAAAMDVNLHLVTCVERSKSQTVKVGSDSFHTDPLSEAEQFLKSVAIELPYDKITTAATFSDPADTLTDEADRLEAHAIVVGNRRVQGVSRVLGSVASDVLRRANCHVFIANTTG